MKGQLMVFEQVMLFAIGVLIFIICFASFSAYQGYFTQAGNDDQATQVRDYIAYSVVRASEGWNSTISYTTIQIPRSIGGEMYKVALSAKGLNLTRLQSQNSSFTGLYGLNLTMELVNSEVSSSSGMIVLYKNGNKIILT